MQLIQSLKFIEAISDFCINCTIKKLADPPTVTHLVIFMPINPFIDNPHYQVLKSSLAIAISKVKGFYGNSLEKRLKSAVEACSLSQQEPLLVICITVAPKTWLFELSYQISVQS